MTKMITQIYRSSKKEGAYLYVEKGKDLNELPETLMALLGRLESSLLLMLTGDKKLAQADAKSVIESIQQQGFYLQLAATDKDYDFINTIPNAKLGIN